MEHQECRKIIHLSNSRGEGLEVELTPEGGCLLGLVYVDGVPYHVERVFAELLNGKYCVDADPDYRPRAGLGGYCILFAPYSR
jgi:hypothetical protein